MTETSTPANVPFYRSTSTMWTEGRDSYGRRTRSLYATHRGQWGTVAVVVTMPKAWVESHGDDRYMVSDWRAEKAGQRPEPVYFSSLAAAKAHAEGLVRTFTEDELAVLDAYAKVVAAADANKLTEWAQHHREGIRTWIDANRDTADVHEVLRRIVKAELDRRTR